MYSYDDRLRAVRQDLAADPLIFRCKRNREMPSVWRAPLFAATHEAEPRLVLPVVLDLLTEHRKRANPHS